MSGHRSHLRREAKLDFENRMAEISQPEYVNNILNMVPQASRGEARAEVCTITKVQNDGTGPATLEYRFDGGPRVFGKLYRDTSGAHCHSVLQELWSNGFGADSRYQVPRPLCFLPELNLMFTLEAAGQTVSSSLGEDAEAALQGVRDSAGWLSRLHASSHRMGRCDGPWYLFLKLADRLSKAAAAHPKQLNRLKKIAIRLRVAQEAQVQPVIVQGHGQFRPIHVFRDGETTAVIDLDRSRPGDPGRDLAEFVHRMRTGVFRAGGGRSQANELTRAFLAEYGDGPAESFGNLPFYHGFNVAVSMCRHLKKPVSDKSDWEKKVEFYAQEFDEAISGVFLPSRVGG